MGQQHFNANDSELTGKAGFEALLRASHHIDESEVERGRIRREEWLQSLESLYQQVQDALAPYVQEKQVSVEFRSFTLVEELVGEYTAKKMLIRFANTEIVLEPAGTMVLAAKGRVDVIGPFGKTPLFLVNSRARRLSDVSQWSISSGSKVLASSQQPTTPTSWEWRVVSKTLDRELISLNEEVILGLFAEIANG